MTADDGEPSRSPPQSSKVARVIDEYELEDFGEELERRWLGEGTEQQSLRELADVLNRRLLEAALRAAGSPASGDELERFHGALTDTETTGGTRQEVRSELARRGVDVDALEGDFVSHQAIHTYLTKYRGVDREVDTDRVASTRAAIERLQGRLQAVVERNLESLASTGRLTIGSADVIVTVSVVCSECNQQYSIFDLLDRGGCACDSQE